MKKMRQIVLPLAILFIGAGSAYATNVASKSAKAEIPGWKIDLANPSAPCVMTEQQCTTDNTGFVCTVSDASGVHDLYQTGCETELFRIP
ncbi:MAG: DUF6520 family protein [Chryseobacterium sp.]|jgi:hypothetical protein|uniref:DUF6520 family protein n=2 Tax=Chryseobacterium group TaxID=2782232 RepID=UPI000427FBCE|nr:MULTISPECIES: DUF6520 family protein [Chryseobacterium]MDN5422514.1 DUF6520 family protein [Chryseobacterium sp.]MDN5476636.1 DUF6520 family protein [Chryseobacterium sp.]QUY56416.1 hypothetical protein I2F65_03490 [Chryseobacterium arthrosphaerae]